MKIVTIIEFGLLLSWFELFLKIQYLGIWNWTLLGQRRKGNLTGIEYEKEFMLANYFESLRPAGRVSNCGVGLLYVYVGS